MFTNTSLNITHFTQMVQVYLTTNASINLSHVGQWAQGFLTTNVTQMYEFLERPDSKNNALIVLTVFFGSLYTLRMLCWAVCRSVADKTIVSQKIIMTPVNLRRPRTYKGFKARAQYKVEQLKFANDYAHWYDSKYNTAKVGDLFGFVQMNENTVEIFQVVRIIHPDDIGISWSVYDFRNRQTLVLSPVKSQMKWSALKRKLGYSRKYQLRGTTRSRNAINY